MQHCSTAWGCCGGGFQYRSTAWGCCGGLQHCSTMWRCCGGVAALQHRIWVLWGGCSTAAPRGDAVWGGLQHCSTTLSARSAALHCSALRMRHRMEEMLRGCIVTLSGCSGLGGSIAALHGMGAVVVEVQHCSTVWGWIMWGGGATLQHRMGVLCGEVAALQHRVGVLWGGCSPAAPRGDAVGGLQHCSTTWGCWGGVAALQQHMGMLWGICSTAAPR